MIEIDWAVGLESNWQAGAYFELYAKGSDCLELDSMREQIYAKLMGWA